MWETLNQDLQLDDDYIIVEKSRLDLYFPKIGEYYRAICLNNGDIGPRCPNNVNSICVIEHKERPRRYYHAWDGKNCYKCPCGEKYRGEGGKMSKDDIGLLRTDPVLNQPKEDLARKGRMNKCPFCGAEVIQRLSDSTITQEITNCHNVFMNGKIYDKRHITCYERQLAHQADLLRRVREVVKWAGSLNVGTSTVGKDFPEYVQEARALLPELEKALEGK